MSFVGQNSSPWIDQSIIDNNIGTGIKIGIANKTQVTNSKILFNKIGIEIISAEPLISNNVIEKNYKYGVIACTYKLLCEEHFRCDGEINNNVI